MTRRVAVDLGQLTPLRIAYVLFRYPQVSQTFVRDEIRAMRALGHEVAVVSLDPPDPAVLTPGADWAGPFEQVPKPPARRALADHLWWLSRSPRRYARFLGLALLEGDRRRSTLLRLPTFARRWRSADALPELLHTHFAWSTSTTVSALAALLDRPTSITVHAKDIYAQPAPVVRRRLHRHALIVTVCNFNVGYLLGARIVEPSAARVQVVACGVEPAASAPSRLVDVVSVGRLVEKKGFDLLLRAVAQASRDLARPITTTIVGDGPDRAALEQLASELGVADAVRFLGALEHDAALAQIAAARIFCLPARPARDGDSDAMPVVLREAMVRGVPVLTTRLAGIPESVDETVGWLVDPGDGFALGAALSLALGDEDERRRRGDAARERALMRWSLEDQAAALAPLFREASSSGDHTPEHSA